VGDLAHCIFSTQKKQGGGKREANRERAGDRTQQQGIPGVNRSQRVSNGGGMTTEIRPGTSV